MKGTKRIYMIAAIVVEILGVVHTCCTPVFYKQFDLNALWFAGSGLSLIFLGLLNILAFRTDNVLVIRTAMMSNIMGFAFIALVTYLLRAPQAFIGVVGVLVCLISSIMEYVKKD